MVEIVKTIINKKTVIAFLFMLSFVLTTGTFAYWANFVEGTSDTSTGTIKVGTAEGVDTIFQLDNELSTGGYLVPIGQLVNSEPGAVEYIDLSFDLEWQEDEQPSQTWGTISNGFLNVSYEIVITRNGSTVNNDMYNRMSRLINIEAFESNATSMTLNGDAETLSYRITLNEPKNKSDYNLLQKMEIKIVFSFIINTSSVDTVDAN